MTQQTAQNTDTTFQTSQCKIIPYATLDGIPTYKDSEIRAFYDKMVRDGVAGLIFHDGYIQDADDFLRMMKGPDVALYIAHYKGDACGVGWLTHFEPKARSCRAHFTAFSEIWGEDTVSIGREIFNQMLHMKADDGEFVFDVFLGLVPAFNVRVIKWLNKVGLVAVGEIPNILWNGKESVPGTLFYLTR